MLCCQQEGPKSGSDFLRCAGSRIAGLQSATIEEVMVVDTLRSSFPFTTDMKECSQGGCGHSLHIELSQSNSLLKGGLHYSLFGACRWLLHGQDDHSTGIAVGVA
ncbi:hypothetical protein MRX96_057853 [Rhipicephalus microplus]